MRLKHLGMEFKIQREYLVLFARYDVTRSVPFCFGTTDVTDMV
jgi:hypothetical protein